MCMWAHISSPPHRSTWFGRLSQLRNGVQYGEQPIPGRETTQHLEVAGSLSEEVPCCGYPGDGPQARQLGPPWSRSSGPPCSSSPFLSRDTKSVETRGPAPEDHGLPGSSEISTRFQGSSEANL